MNVDECTLARLLREQAKAREEQARLLGRLEGSIEAWARGPEGSELLRAQVWLNAGATVRMSEDGKFTHIPSGWPEGMDGDRYLADWVKERMAEHEQPETPKSHRESSSSVVAFRKRLART